MKLKVIYRIFLICGLFSCLSVNAEGKEIYTGMYGVWAWKTWDEGATLLVENKFKITLGQADKSILDQAAQKGLQYMVHFGLTKEITQDATKWQSFKDTVRKSVTQLKGHPAVFAWYPVDEADGQGIPTSYIKEIVTLIRSIDNKTPIFAVFDIPNKWSNYLPYFDIVAIDPYLKPGDKADKVKTYLQKLKKDMKKLKIHKPMWVVLGAFELTYKNGNPFYVKPTPAQFNEMVNISLGEGVNGILVYTLASLANNTFKGWNLVTDDPPLWDAVRNLPVKVAK